MTRTNHIHGMVHYPPNTKRIVTSAKLRELRAEQRHAGAFKDREVETWAKLLFLLAGAAGS